MKAPPPEVIAAHMASMFVTPRTDCMIWIGAQSDRGYGLISIAGRSFGVHRVAWELANGPIPEGLTVDHLCSVRNCINTAHMEVVTNGENARRALERRPRFGRPLMTREGVIPVPKTHCKRDHEFTPENTYFLPSDGHRRCRTCRAHIEQLRKQRARERAQQT